MSRSFEDLVLEASAAPVAGWDFSWLDGRASEERPSWGYARTLGAKMALASTALDIQTGGGEVLAGVSHRAPLTVATESWLPNIARADQALRPLGVAVVLVGERQPLPFAGDTFDLVASRHPVTECWAEVARVLRPGGRYFSQQVGPSSMFELVEHFLGPQPAQVRNRRHPDQARSAAEAAGLRVTELRQEMLRAEFSDIGAVIYFLRKVIWMVPDFTVERYIDRLRALHERIAADGPFLAHAARFLIEARKPD